MLHQIAEHGKGFGCQPQTLLPTPHPLVGEISELSQDFPPFPPLSSRTKPPRVQAEGGRQSGESADGENRSRKIVPPSRPRVCRAIPCRGRGGDRPLRGAGRACDLRPGYALRLPGGVAGLHGAGAGREYGESRVMKSPPRKQRAEGLDPGGAMYPRPPPEDERVVGIVRTFTSTANERGTV